MAGRLRWRCENTRALGRWLSWAGVLVFLVSLLLPAIALHLNSEDSGWDLGMTDPFSGWYCNLTVIYGLREALCDQGRLSSAGWMSTGFGLSNLLMLSAPLLLWKVGRHPKALRVVAALYLFSALNAARLMWGTDQLLIGYYAWLLSFGLLAVGCLLRSVPVRSLQTPVMQLFAFRPRTQEELAAERELRDYLSRP